ncbi:MAG: TetR family transcriptional regulator [Acidimicrobiia bacterium]|nr:TetR family transcriptional regulator [Acidimicrobiia bacterium]
MKAGRKQERRLQHQDLSRAQLLDAAEEVFGRRGFHDATLKEVAERAEFSVGSVYSFFANKDDVFLHVFLRRGGAFLAGMGAAAATQDPAVQRLRDLVAFEVGFFRAHPHFGRLYLRTSSAGSPLPAGGVDGAYAGGLERAMAVHASVFAAGQAERALRSGDPDVLARILSGIVTAYLAVDPAVIGEDDASADRMSLEELQDFVTEAFRA